VIRVGAGSGVKTSEWHTALLPAIV
jgi:hypothetical protein